MGLAEAAIRGIVDSVAFRASAAPYLILDTDLRICAANLAYRQATLLDSSAITGELMFDVFPDNPATPEARSVERLGHSFERALLNGRPHRMELQRYDVLQKGCAFVEKSWLPTNSPIRGSDGRTVGVLHHVEDVTRLLAMSTLEGALAAAPVTPHAPRPGAGGPSQVDALRLDSLERRARAQILLHRSRRAMQRVSRRLESSEKE